MVELFLQEMFPAWHIQQDRNGVWRATGRCHLTASNADGLLDLLAKTDPDAMKKAAEVFRRN
ncbi:hypothetical protein [Spirillospora sp. CA-294931]|uniref:hypothetical protein n=1 Tax=Spirillospora sp. CA-294931 TaxID=3240042 RepID=UPI003D8D0FA0